MRHLTNPLVFATCFGLIFSCYASAAEVDESILYSNYINASEARLCGDNKLAQQLRAITLEYYSLQIENLDRFRAGKKFDVLSEAYIEMSLTFESEKCKTKLTLARRELAKTQALVRSHPSKSRSKTPSESNRPDTLSSINEMIMECNSDAIEVGEKMFAAKRNGVTKSVTLKRVERTDAIWPAKSVTAIYARSTSATDAGDSAKLMCIMEANTRLSRLTGQ